MKTMKHKNSIKPLRISVISGLLVCVLMINGCSQGNIQPETEVTETSTTPTSETTAPEPAIDYHLNWMDKESREFAKYYEGNYHITLGEYIYYLGGLDDNINYSFTNFVNLKYNTNYESVPFSEAAYFRSYTIGERGESGYFQKTESYDIFCLCYLEGINTSRGVLTNKAVVSYLYINNIPLGKPIPLENLKALQVKDMNSLVHPSIDLSNWLLHKYQVDVERINGQWPPYGDMYRSDQLFMQHDISASTKFTNEELCRLLLTYNSCVRGLAADERILDLDLLSENPKFKDIGKGAIEAYNKHLDAYYGGKGLRFGEVPTLEQFRYVYDDEPLDLSYIPGVVISPKTIIPYPDGSVAEIK